MSNYCDQCYETASLCPRAGDSTKACHYVITNPLALRTAAGGYETQLQQASVILGAVAPAHIDALLCYQSGGSGPLEALTADEQTIMDSKGNQDPWDVLDHTNTHLGLSLVRKRPAEYMALKSRLEKVLVMVTTQANQNKVTLCIDRLDKDYEKYAGSQITSGATTATAYREATYPHYQLWTHCLKKVLHGHDSAEVVDEKTFFDTSTGKPIVPFEKMPKCKTPAHLFRAFSMFKEAITVLKCLAPRAWSGMESAVYRTEASLGFLIAQQFVGEVLRRLDRKEYCNIGALMANGEHNRIVDDLRPPLGTSGPPEPKPGTKGHAKM